MKSKSYRVRYLLPVMVILLILLSIIATSWGQVDVPLHNTMEIIFKHWGLPGYADITLNPQQDAVIYFIRLPRVFVGVLVGAGLAVSGAVMQGIFSNPLADPGIIGVSSGAAFGAITAISLGLTTTNLFTMPFFAAGGSLLAVLLTVMLATHKGRIPVIILLLAGIAVSMFMGALSSGLLTILNEHRVREYLFWMVGGLDYRRWEHVYLAAGPILSGIGICCLLARHMNVLVLGENEARAVGASVQKMRIGILAVASVITAFSVCVSGAIGFVGLVVPHIMRVFVGPDHRLLIPVSALAGGIFLVACDVLARMIVPSIEIRVGVITALVGAPYFLYLLRRVQRSEE